MNVGVHFNRLQKRRRRKKKIISCFLSGMEKWEVTKKKKRKRKESHYCLSNTHITTPYRVCDLKWSLGKQNTLFYNHKNHKTHFMYNSIWSKHVIWFHKTYWNVVFQRQTEQSAAFLLFFMLFSFELKGSGDQAGNIMLCGSRSGNQAKD